MSDEKVRSLLQKEELSNLFNPVSAIQIFFTPPPFDPKEFSQYMKDGVITGGLILLSLGIVIVGQNIINGLPLLPHNPTTGDVTNNVAFIEFCLSFPIMLATTVALRQATRRIFHTPLKY